MNPITDVTEPSRILTTVVGSYPVPAWLAAQPSTSNVRDAVMVVLKTQELAGIDVVTDGEISRFDINHPETNGMIEYFTRPMQGIRSQLTRAEIEEFRRQPSMGFRARPAGVVTAHVAEGQLDLLAAYESVRHLSSQPYKFTVTSPYMLARTLLDTHYHDQRALAMDIAEVLREQVALLDADIIQVDEASLPGTPQDGVWAAEVINHVLSTVKHSKAVHLCFGNYGGQTIQQGSFRKLLPFINALECDHVILEFARRGYEELAIFKDLKPSIAMGIGVIDIKDNEVEKADEIARRIEYAVKLLGSERVRWVHPDCGFWMLPRSVVDRKMAVLVKGRDRFEDHAR